MNWLPIETYDAMKKKPKLAAFYFEAAGDTPWQSWLCLRCDCGNVSHIQPSHLHPLVPFAGY